VRGKRGELTVAFRGDGIGQVLGIYYVTAVVWFDVSCGDSEFVADWNSRDGQSQLRRTGNDVNNQRRKTSNDKT
jgi:hypothetical protein